MMEFLENPIWLGGGGLLLAGATFMGWVQTGHKAALWGAIVIAVLTIVGVVILMRIETEKEKIETMLHHMAHDLETNDFDRLIENFSGLYARLLDNLPKEAVSTTSFGCGDNLAI